MEEAPPSRVIHIRKLPNEASETEVIALGLPFGKVTNILTLKGKNQVSESNRLVLCIYTISYETIVMLKLKKTDVFSQEKPLDSYFVRGHCFYVSIHETVELQHTLDTFFVIE